MLVVPAAAVRARDSAAASASPTITPLPGGGMAYFFPARPDVPATAPDPWARGLVTAFEAPRAAVTSTDDDRDNTDSTPWYVYEHQTATDVYDLATTNNLRVVDWSIESTAGDGQISAVYVSNTQSFAKTWWILANVTPTDLYSFVTTNNARIVSQKVFADPAPGGDVRHYAILVSNTGQDAKTWYFYNDQTIDQLTALLQANDARIVQVNAYRKNGVTLYAAVMIQNTGTDNRVWWWYVNESISDIGDQLTANNARIVDLDPDPTTGNYNVVMNSCAGGCPAWWWYVGVPTSSLIDTADQFGARLIDVNTTAGCSDQCWAIVMTAMTPTPEPGTESEFVAAAALLGLRVRPRRSRGTHPMSPRTRA